MITENCLPLTDEVTVDLVPRCLQNLHLLALHLEILGYIPHLLNGLEYFRRIRDSILNDRLNTFLEDALLLSENQAGFRKQYSTLDHIFSLTAIIEIMKQWKKKLFCCFVDFSSAFDSVWRVGLWQKVLKTHINGKVLRVIYNMYYDIKSCISLNGSNSPFFASSSGVRQGENLSPVLFAIYLNDLEEFLLANPDLGVTFDCDNEYISIFFKPCSVTLR